MVRTEQPVTKVEQHVWVEYGKDYTSADMVTLHANSDFFHADHEHVPIEVLEKIANKNGFDGCSWSSGHGPFMARSKFFTDLDTTHMSVYGIYCRFYKVISKGGEV